MQRSKFEPDNLKHGDFRMGRFYPQGYVFAVFPDEQARDSACSELGDRGWASEDLIDLEGRELQQFDAERRQQRSTLESIYSKFGDKDQVYFRALELAGDPHYRFSLIYAPDPARRDVVVEALQGKAELAQSFDKLSFNEIRLKRY